MIKYNILITLIILFAFYGIVHIIEAFFEQKEDLDINTKPPMYYDFIEIIRYYLYKYVYIFFILSFFYFYIKSMTIKINENIAKTKTLMGISKSLYFWIDYGIRVKKKRDLKIKKKMEIIPK